MIQPVSSFATPCSNGLLSQSVWAKARENTLRAHGTLKFLFLVEVLMGGVGGAVALAIMPNDWSDAIQAVGATVGAFVAILATVGCIFLVSLVIAPIQQRNEARGALVAAGFGPNSIASIASHLSDNTREVFTQNARHFRRGRVRVSSELTGEALNELRRRGVLESRMVDMGYWPNGVHKGVSEYYWLTGLGGEVLDYLCSQDVRSE